MSTPERVAVVTGAAAGLGQAYAIRLGRAGFRLALLDLGASDETSTILEGMGVTAHSWACDVSDWDSVESVSQSVVDYFGRSDVLINNAGIYPSSKFDDISPADWRKMMAVNLDGTFYMCRAFVPHMRAKSTDASSTCLRTRAGSIWWAAPRTSQAKWESSGLPAALLPRSGRTASR